MKKQVTTFLLTVLTVFPPLSTTFTYKYETQSDVDIIEKNYITQPAQFFTSCENTVINASIDISLNRRTLTLGVGESYGLVAKITGENNSQAISWTVSDSSVVKVDDKGQITALSCGVANVTATLANGSTSICKITVKNAPSSVKLNAYRVNMDIGSTYTLKQSFPDDCYAWYFSFTSDDPTVVTVERRTGELKAVSSGIANITVHTYNGKSATCTVDVSVVKRTAFYTSNKTESDIKKLSNKYPDLIEVLSIGNSTKGKNIPLVKLGNGSKKGSIVAGIHGRENITINFTLLSIEDYCRAYYSSSGLYGIYNMKSLLNEYTLYIVPMCNPDGTDICNNNELPIDQSSADRYYYKGNANNVNLNANFPFYWSEVTDSDRQKGPSAASETETENLMEFCESNNFEWLLDMHIVGNCLFWRDSANGTITDDYAMASALRDKCGYYLCPTTADVNGYGGGFENWFRNETGNPGICVELVKSDHTTQYTNLYDYNRNFNTALNWNKTKYTFAVAMNLK